jgi:hypothetical protein
MTRLLTTTSHCLARIGIGIALLALPRAVAAQGFDTPVTLAGAPSSVVAADVNGDGLRDLLAAGVTFRVYLAEGPARFRPPLNVAFNGAAANGFSALAVADFNGDRHLDAAVGLTEALAILLGDGTGRFTLARQYAMPQLSSVHTVVARDLTGDGVLDLVVGIPGPFFNLGLFVGDGTGRFEPPSGSRALRLGSDCGQSVMVGELTGDSQLDVLVPCVSAPAYLVPSQGAGGFGEPQPFIAPHPFKSAAMADFNEDGAWDLVYASVGAHVLLRSTASGDRLVSIPTSFDSVLRVTAGDVNGDGHADLVAGGMDAMQVLLGDGAGRFMPLAPVPTAVVGELEIADLDGDGFGDVIVGGVSLQYALYVPSEEERARPVTTSLDRIELTLGGMNAALTDVAARLGTLQLPDLSRLAALDAAVSSRASQESVNTLGLALGALDVPVSSRASANALVALDSKLDTRIDGQTERLESAGLRLAIELALARGDRVFAFYIPESHGGVLERVRQVVVEAIATADSLDIATTRAKGQLTRGDDLLRAGQYRAAFDAYANAYQLLAR